MIDEDGSQEVEHLKSNQEEADTKVVLHCLDALRTPEATVALRSHSGDTDIMVLAVTLIRDHFERLFVYYGSGKHRKALRVSEINMSEKEKYVVVRLPCVHWERLHLRVFHERKSHELEMHVKERRFCSIFC